MHNLLKVSVIILARNEEKKIEKCINSIYNINLPNNLIEIILIDSNSTDATVSIVKKFDVRIYKILKPNFGTAINVGVENAKGDYILRVDGDSIVPKNFLKNAIKKLESDRSIALVGGLREEADPTTIIGQIYHKRFQADKVGEQLVVSGNILFDRRLFMKYINRLPETNCQEDFLICLKFIMNGFKCLRMENISTIHDSSYHRLDILLQAKKKIFLYAYENAMFVKSLSFNELRFIGLRDFFSRLKFLFYLIVLFIISSLTNIFLFYIGILLYLILSIIRESRNFNMNYIGKIYLGIIFSIVSIISNFMFILYLFLPFPKRGIVLEIK